MGVGTKKRPTANQPTVRKPKVQTGVGGGAAPPGCPDSVLVEGTAQASVGHRVSLTLTGGRVQLVIGNRVTPFSKMQPGRAQIVRCLEDGESYVGTVTRVAGGRFEATLERA